MPFPDAPKPIDSVVTGVFAIALGVGFNVPYAILAMTYDYPGVLRAPAGHALELFAAGGPGLVLTWHAFAVSALLMIPLSIALALTPRAVAKTPALAIGAAIAGSLAGLAQAIGLWRWVFVVPGLARAHTEPSASPSARLAAEQTFELINQYGGVAVGEHLGQMLTVIFMLMLSMIQWGEGRRVTGGIGVISAAALLIGSHEGLALALDQPGDVFSYATIAGFLGLSVWLCATGLGLMRGRLAKA